MDEGSDIILQGSITGSQPIKVSWLHNGEKLEPPPIRRLHRSRSGGGFTACVFVLRTGEVANFGQPSFNGREVELVVKDSLPEDAGEYTCLAENSAGRTSSSGAVEVRGQ